MELKEHEEIEITREMIEAGAAVLDELCPGHGSYPHYVVEQIFLTMANRALAVSTFGSST